MPTNNEITIVFKAKTEEAANSIKKASQNIEGLSVAGNKADSSMRKIGKSVENAGDSAKRASKSWGTMALEINNAIDLARRGLRTLKSVYDMAKEGAKFQEVSLYAKNAAEKIGLSFDSMVKASQRGANGMASNFTIMKANLKALKGGLVASEKDFEQLWKIANASSDELGQSIEQTFEQITKAITTGNAKSLVSMGLLPESFKKASNSTDLLKNRSELLKTVLEQLGPKADELGKYGETAADKFQQFETAVNDLNTELKICLADCAEPIVTFMRDDGIPILKSTIDLLKNEGVPIFKNFTGILKDYYDWVSKGKFSGEFQGSKLGVQGVIEQKRLEIEDLKKWKSEVQKDFDYLDKQWWLGDYDNERFAKAYNAGNKFNGKSDALASIKAQLDTVDKLITDATNHLEKFKEEARTSIKVDQFTNYLKDLKKSTISGAESLFPHIFGKETVTELKTVSNSINNIDSKFSSIASKIDTLAKDKLPKLPETTSEMLDVSTEVLSAASLMPNYWFKTGEKIEDVNKKLEEQNKKLEETRRKVLETYKDDIFEAFTGKKSIETQFYSQSDAAKAKNASELALMAGGNLSWLKPLSAKLVGVETRQDINETADYLQKQFTDGISNAIADGFASADFSGFASNLQSVISGVVGSGVSASISSALTKTADKSGVLGNGLFKQVVNDSGKISLGALGGNLLTGGLIGTATNFLFGEGGIFGKTKIVGKENLNKSAELNAQVDQAKELAESIYLATGISDYTRELIDNAVYNKTWTTTSKSKNLFKKKKTISLHGAAEAQASIKYVEDLQKQALGEQALNNYNNYMLGRDNSVAASYNSYLDAQKAYEASQVMLYSDEEKAGFQTDIQNKEKRIKELNSLKNKKDKYSYYYTSYYANNEINTLNNEITSLREKLDSSYKYDLETRTEMLQQMEEAHVNYIKAQQDARSNLLSSFTGSSTLASLLWDSSQPKYKYTDSNGRKIYGSDPTMNMLLGNQEVMGNSDMIKTMLPLLEQSYMKDYDLNQRLNSSDENVRKEALVEQQSILEKALNSYEKIYKDAKDEALNTNLSTEEQSAAFERWQETFQAYLSLQEQIAENTKTIADIEESNALSKLSTELGDMLSIVAEIKNQKSTNNTLVFRQSLSEEEIIAKLKEVAGAKNPELASVLGEILNDKQNASIWG